jgi:hypothetical protein
MELMELKELAVNTKCRRRSNSQNLSELVRTEWSLAGVTSAACWTYW